jgi:hypothetical protein
MRPTGVDGNRAGCSRLLGAPYPTNSVTSPPPPYRHDSALSLSRRIISRPPPTRCAAKVDGACRGAYWRRGVACQRRANAESYISGGGPPTQHNIGDQGICEVLSVPRSVRVSQSGTSTCSRARRDHIYAHGTTTHNRCLRASSVLPGSHTNPTWRGHATQRSPYCRRARFQWSPPR